jgi:hypothetical protein
MQTTIDIDEDILKAATARARFSGRTTSAVIAEVLRQGLGIAEPELEPMRDGCPQIRFDPAFVPSSESILELLQRVEQQNDLGPPLIISPVTMDCIERIASQNRVPLGGVAAQSVEESLLLQKKWPSHDGELEPLRRSDGTPVMTLEYIKYLQDKMDFEDYLGGRSIYWTSMSSLPCWFRHMRLGCRPAGGSRVSATTDGQPARSSRTVSFEL